MRVICSRCQRLALGLVLLSYWLAPQAEWARQTDHAMGTLINVELWHAQKNHSLNCASQVMSEMHRIDSLMSPYRAQSEISKINRQAASAPVKVSAELFQLLEAARGFSELSGGAFDITFASVGNQYDFRNGIQPSDSDISVQLGSIDYRLLVLQEQTVHFKRPGMRIDLGGIAKGHAVDRAIEILQGCNIRHAIVSAGGDSRILGDRKGRAWMMGIQHPRDKQQIALSLPLSNSAISTSGDYERFFLHQGERIHHILNPKTGRSAKSTWSASVIGPDATSTDALSTALFILGAKKGIALINSLNDIDAIIIDSLGVVHYSDGLEAPGTKDQ